MTSHHEPTGRDRPLTRRQLARLAQFHAGVFVFYAVDALFLLALGLQGVVPAPLWWMYALVGGCSAAVAIALFHRSPRRARDVDVNNLVMSSCGAVLMLVTAWFAPATGGLMLMTLMTVLATAALQVTLRSLVFVWLAFAGGTAAAIALSAEAFTLPMATTAQRLLTIAWFAWALAKSGIVSVEGTRLRRQAGDANARLEEALGELARLAETDELTVIPNRRSIASELQRALEKATGTVAVALFDIDHFKAVNDRFGHATGDAVLCDFAVRLSGVLRPEDRVGRYGGEEFLVVLKDLKTDAAACDAAERIRREVAAHDWPRLAPGLRITASAGVALARPGESASQAVARADAALYAAKAGGRDRVVLAAMPGTVAAQTD